MKKDTTTMEIIGPGVQRKTMTENIKHMREIAETGIAWSEYRDDAMKTIAAIESEWCELKQEMSSSDRLCRILADILTATANVLKGPPGELKEHSWHDLPEKAKELVSQLSIYQTQHPTTKGRQ